MECTDLTEDEILAVLQKPIRDLTENWNIDLSQHLQKYLNMLEISEANQDRLSIINFQKAAQVIQNSAYIYSKKVDYLWEVLLRVLDVFRTKSEYPLLQKAKVKKISICYKTDTSDFCELDDLSDGDSDINIPSGFDVARPPLKFLPKYNPSLDTNFSEKNLYILSSNGIIIGNKYDFRVNRHFSETGALVAEPQIRLNSSVASTSGHHDPQMRLCSLVSSTSGQPEPQIILNSSVASTSGQHEPQVRLKQLQVMAQSSPCSGDCFDSHLLNIVTDGDPQNSCDDFEPHSSFTTQQNGDCNYPEIGLNEIKKVPEVAPQILPKRTIKRKNGEPQPADILSYLAEDIASKCENNLPFFSFVEYSTEKKGRKGLEPFFNSKKDEIVKISNDLATEFSDEFYGFETESLLSDLSEDCNDVHEDDNMECGSVSISTCVNGSTICNNSDHSSRSGSPTFEEFSKNLLSNSTISKQENQHMMERINTWHESIKKKLLNSEKRHHCDLKEYSSHILDTFAKSDNSTVSFNEIVHEKPQEDVPRYFLASLMMANSYTVKVETAGQDSLAMDCMQLALLKNDEGNG